MLPVFKWLRDPQTGWLGMVVEFTVPKLITHGELETALGHVKFAITTRAQVSGRVPPTDANVFAFAWTNDKDGLRLTVCVTPDCVDSESKVEDVLSRIAHEIEEKVPLVEHKTTA